MTRLIVPLMIAILAYCHYAIVVNANSDVNAKNELLHVLRKFESLQSQNEALLAKFAEFEQQRETLTRLEREHERILNRLASLYHQNNVQKDLITSLKDKLLFAEERIQSLENRVSETHSIQMTNKQVLESAQQLQDNIQKSSGFANSPDDSANLKYSQNEPARSDSPIRDIRALLSEGPPVAFFSTISTHDYGQLGNRQTIIFDTAVTNLGNAYNPSHGIFVAPYRGLYMLSATIAFWKISANEDMYVHFNLNGKVILKYFGSYADLASHTILLSMDPGDEVSLTYEGGTGGVILGDHFSSFSGLMVSRIGLA